jgi:DivIVA domain-containing protein
MAPVPSSVGDPAARQFSTSFRGYEPNEVRSYLRAVAAELDQLRALLNEAQRPAPPAALVVESVDLDEDEVTRLVGEETARVLRTAREAAADIRARAADELQRSISEATTEASRIRADADADAAQRRQRADADAHRTIEDAKAEGRQLVTEAKALRERVLSDLSRRRDVGRRQLDQLHAAHTRILTSFGDARGALDSAYADLDLALPAAQQLAGDALATPLLAPLTADTADSADVSSATEPHATRDETPSDDVAGAAADDIVTDPATSDTVETVDDADEGPTEDSGEQPSDDAATESEPENGESPSGHPADANADAGVDRDERLDATESESEPPSEAGPIPDDDDAAAQPVDLFARLRAERDADVAQAREIFAAGEQTAEGDGAQPDDESGTSQAPTTDTEAPDDATQEIGDSSTGEANRDFVDPAPAGDIAKRVTRQLRRLLNDDQNDVLDRLRRQKKVSTHRALFGETAEVSSRYRATLSADVPANALDSVMLIVEERVLGPLDKQLGDAVAVSQGDPDEYAVLVRAAYRDVRGDGVDALAERMTGALFAG